MKDPWVLLERIEPGENGGVEALAMAPKNSPWFTGHFPGEPILPGIALIDTIFLAIQEAARGQNETVKIGKLRRVRFTRPVLPGERFTISFTQSVFPETWKTFKVFVGENIVCSGQIAVQGIEPKQLSQGGAINA